MSGRISLEKRISEYAPHLIDLAKKFTITLGEKATSGYDGPVALVLDATGSMRAQYRDGKVQHIIGTVKPPSRRSTPPLTPCQTPFILLPKVRKRRKC